MATAIVRVFGHRVPMSGAANEEPIRAESSASNVSDSTLKV